MNLNLGLGGYDGPNVGMQEKSAYAGQLAKPRTLREQLQDQIAFHKRKVADLEEACEALSPDVEKALNALAKL
jgi:hypothetical protein